MIMWMGIVGALTGWCLGDFEEWMFVLGGVVGLFAGWVLSRGVRAEVARATKTLQDQVDALLAHGFAPAAVAPQAPVEIAPDPVPRTATIRAAPPERVATTASEVAPEQRAPAPVVPPAPAEPTMLDTAFAAAKGWLFGGNTIVRMGLVILFVGLSFLASYAASAGLFPIELRLALVAAIGIALLGVGFRTRTHRPEFGLALQGGGVATLYLTLFAAAKLYDTIPIAAAFVLMVVVCALGCALALLQRSQALAATSFAGGFAVPLLLASGGGPIIGVFVYYTILNLAILFIAHRQAWRVLNLIGFFATFGAATLWGTSSYQPGDFAAAQAFLILSVLIYVATAVLYTRATPGRFGNVVDTTLLFGPALAGFGLEVGLVHDRPFGSAFAALGFAALYLAVAGWTMRYRRETFRVMNETMLAIGIGFVTLAVPLALGARWTSAAWALEGAGAFWVGMRQARWMPRLFGMLLQLLAAFVFVAGARDRLSAIPLANPGFVGAMLIALAALGTAWWLRERLPTSGSRLANGYAEVEAHLGKPVFLFGFFFWCLAWALEVTRNAPSLHAGLSPAPAIEPALWPLLIMLTYVVSAWIAATVARRLRWPVATWPSHGTLAALALAFVATTRAGRHVPSLPDAIIWAVGIALHLRLLYLNDRAESAVAPVALLQAEHVGGVWLATAMLADCLWLGVDRARLWGSAWADAAFLIGAIAVLAALTLTAGRAMGRRGVARRWPIDAHATGYGWRAAIPIAALAYLGALVSAVTSAGNAAPLPYIPLLNPIDLTLGIALGGLALWRRTMLESDPRPKGVAALEGYGPLAALAGLAFVIVNTIWLRTAHQLLGVAWNGDALLGSVVVQSGLAILWTSLALALMVTASRRKVRGLWLAGAGLLGLTVVKLLLVDLANSGGGATIVAFIVVGVLMLVVGYLAPLPPRGGPPVPEGATA
ncbi:DUF2339 domain-containing protein [Sphingomonas sp. Tas61C01]|uniref:DUF2339 domain-containing protein n=1 Tax=Sphingomonas sp. Tas61C01 TaxID=3458297 RepID=UPI00403EE2D1